MHSSKAYYLHTGARSVIRISGGFFLGMGLLSIIAPLTNRDPFGDPDIWFVLIFGAGFTAVGLRILFFAQRAKILLGEESAVVSTFIGRQAVRYDQITHLGMMTVDVVERGLRGRLIRKRTGGRPVHFFMKDGGRIVKRVLVSGFENHCEIIDEIGRRSKQKVVCLTQTSVQEWMQEKEGKIVNSQ